MPAYQQTLAEILREFPDFKLTRKSTSRFMAFLNFLLTAITFGKSNGFMHDVTTTVGNTIYIPTHWDDWDIFSRTSILRHERVHMRQRKRMGSIRFFLTYMFWPVPVLFAAGRAKLEMEAYEESMRATVFFQGIQAIESAEYREYMISHFTGANYFWMWPFKGPITDWYDGVVQKIKAERERE